MSQQSRPKSERAPEESNLINLRGHQAAERVVQDLLRAPRGTAKWGRLLSEAATLGPTLLAAVARHLDSGKPPELLALADLLSAHAGHAQAVPTLARVAMDRRNSDQKRMGAALVLSSVYLQSPPTDEFLAGLRNPTATLAQSLDAFLHACTSEPEMLDRYATYVALLLSQPVDTLHATIGALADMAAGRCVPALRLLALHPHPDLMSEVIETLGASGSSEAIKALAALEPNLPAELAPSAQRQLHKMRLSGLLRGDPLRAPVHGCRALLSAIDGHGERMLWLYVPAVRGEGYASYLGMLISDLAGIVEAVGCEGYPASSLAPRLPIGALHSSRIVQSFGGAQNHSIATYVEVPFLYGLRVLRKGISKNWVSGTPVPVPYGMLFHTVWQYGRGVESYELFGGAAPDKGIQDYTEHESDLLEHPLFENWYLESVGIRSVAREIAGLPGRLAHQLTDESWQVLLPSMIRLAHDEFGAELRIRYAGRLRAMSDWLRLSGHTHEADLALSAARTIVDSPPEANLFVLKLVQRGLLMALSEYQYRK